MALGAGGQGGDVALRATGRGREEEEAIEGCVA